MAFPKTNQPHQDVVYTPADLAKSIIEHFQPAGRILDPARGGGAFFDALPDGTDWCELAEGRDFMDYDKAVDWIITNPPWSRLRQFYAKAFELPATNIVYLHNINGITTKARIRDIEAAGYGIREILCVDTPKSFPQTGFQLAAIHTQRGYRGPLYFTRLKNEQLQEDWNK